MPKSNARPSQLADLVSNNLIAWEGEEESVQTEHKRLIRRLQQETPRINGILRAHDRLLWLVRDAQRHFEGGEMDIRDWVKSATAILAEIERGQ